MVDYVERDIRRVSCDDCGAGAGRPCINYPSGRAAHTAHTSRYRKAQDDGYLSTAEFTISGREPGVY